MIVAAVDVGGTRTKTAAVEAGTGRIVDRLDPVPSGATWPEACAVVETLVARLAHGRRLAGIGVAVPGIVVSGRLASLPGKFPGAEGSAVAAWASALVPGGQAALVVNDAVAAGIGEAGAGAGAGHARMVMVTLGTGVGVCVVERGRPLGAGPFGAGILGGQIPLGDEGAGGDDVGTSGRGGTIEVRCRVSALVDHGRRAGGPWSRAEDVVAAASAGDPVALTAMARYRAGIVTALVALASAHGPDVVVVGGGGAEAGPLLFAGLADAVNERLTFGLRVEVVASRLGGDAALAGLGLLLGEGRP